MSPSFDPWAKPKFPEPLAQGQAAHPRPQEALLSVTRAPALGTCPECGQSELASYRTLSEGGWWHVTKCQECLASVSREPAGLFGSYKPLGLTAPIRFGKESS